MTDTLTPVPDSATRPPNAITHGACGTWWTGPNRAHCPVDGCHRTFSGDSAADKHRVGTYGPDGDRRCVDPATVGLVVRQMPYGDLWGWPAPDEDKAAILAALRESETATA